MKKRFTPELSSGRFQRYVERQILFPLYCQREGDHRGGWRNVPLVKLEITSSSHPFYTGKQKLVDTAGRVDKFMSRYGDRSKKK